MERVPDVEFTGASNPKPMFLLYDQIGIESALSGQARQMLFDALVPAIAGGRRVFALVLSRQGVRVVHDLNLSNDVSKAALLRLNDEKHFVKSLPFSMPAKVDSAAVDGAVAALKILFETPFNGSNIPAVRAELLGLQQLGTSLRNTAGRKRFLWLNSEFPINRDDSVNEETFRGLNRDQDIDNLTIEHARATELLNRARISLYPLQLGSDAWTSGGLDELASATGGKLFRSRSVMDAQKDLEADHSTYYLIECDPDVPKSLEWRGLDIKLSTGEKPVKPAGYFALPEKYAVN